MSKDTLIIHSGDCHQCGFVRFHWAGLSAMQQFTHSMNIHVEHHNHLVMDGNLMKDVQSVVIQRPMNDIGVKICNFYSNYRNTYKYNLVFDFDDMIWDREKYKDNIKKIAELPNFVVCSTRRLAREWKKISSRPAIVVPNGVPGFVAYQKDESIREVPLVWYGGALEHDADFTQTWIDWLVPSIDKGEIKFACIEIPKPLECVKDKIVKYDPVTPAEYLTFVSKLAPDFYIAPLLGNDFTRCKSDLKVKECAAIGSVFLGSKIGDGPYDYIDDSMLVGAGDSARDKFKKLCEAEEYKRCRKSLMDMYESKNWNIAEPKFMMKWLEGYMNGREISIQ